jgi:hypothetical protein
VRETKGGASPYIVFWTVRITWVILIDGWGSSSWVMRYYDESCI